MKDEARQIAAGFIVDVYGVRCPSCQGWNHMPYECLPKHEGWDELNCDTCGVAVEYRGWQNGPEVDYHSRLAVRNILGEQPS
jgi:hypothetical protein